MSNDSTDSTTVRVVDKATWVGVGGGIDDYGWELTKFSSDNSHIISNLWKELTNKTSKIPFIERLKNLPQYTKEVYDQIIGEFVSHIEYLNGLAWRDPVTLRLNRHSFEREMEAMIKPRLAAALKEADNGKHVTLKDSKEFQHPDHRSNVVVAMIDLNYLKQFNDFSYTHGGDAALRYMGDFLHSNLRTKCDPKDKEGIKKLDSVIRYGGDEFAVIMRGCSIEDAKKKMQKLQQAILEKSIDPKTGCVGTSDDGISINLPLSFAFGCTELSLNGIDARRYDDGNFDFKELIRKAINKVTKEAGEAEKDNKEPSKKQAAKHPLHFPYCKTRAQADKIIPNELFKRVEQEKEARAESANTGGLPNFKDVFNETKDTLSALRDAYPKYKKQTQIREEALSATGSPCTTTSPEGKIQNIISHKDNGFLIA